MGGYGKVLRVVLSGRSDANVRFADLVALLARLGFSVRVRGSHHIVSREGIAEIINLQPRGAAAKPYQVKQVREILLRYEIGSLGNGQV